MNLNQLLADQTQRDYAESARRRFDRPPRAERTMRRAFWHERLVVTVSFHPSKRAA